MILFRPVGLTELKSIANSGFRTFSPRLPEEPVFYSLLDFENAEQIVRDSYISSTPFAGFITRFEINDKFFHQFTIQTVGMQGFRGIMVYDEELLNFNQQLVSKIEIAASIYGSRFSGEIDEATNLPKQIAAIIPKTFVITVSVIIEKRIDFDYEDPYIEIDEYSDHLTKSVQAFVGKMPSPLGWNSTSVTELGNGKNNSGRCIKCGAWVTDREKIDPIYGLDNGATVDGNLFCDECLPKDHQWAF